MLRALKEKDAEMRRQLAEAREREELLKLQVREAVRAGRDVTGCQQTGACSGTIQKLQQEATALRSQNKRLEERWQVNVMCDCTNGWNWGELMFPLLVFLRGAPITVHCTSSQVNIVKLFLRVVNLTNAPIQGVTGGTDQTSGEYSLC